MKLSISLLGYSSSLFTVSHASAFNWDAITPTWDLRYTQCYSKFECARILMPLDYLNTTDNRTVAIAVLKVPATVDVTDPAYGGTLMVNPGGPGDSGIVHMLKNGRYIQHQIDGHKHYEVLSFDLRGVAYSTPRADCYSNEAAREAATWQSRGLGDLDSSDEGLKKHLVLSKAYGYQCARYRDEGVDFNIHEYTSTASIARDMLRLVDETEALRQKKLEVRTAAQVPLGGGNKEPRLMYYGTSYGTILGNTFLSMFPGRVRRMMLDGVVVPESWIDVDWSGNFRDTENANDYLYQTCFNAKSNCTLRKDTDKSWHDIQRRVDELIERLNADPVPGPTDNGPEIFITGSDIMGLIFSQLYSPLDFFEGLSTTLAQAIDGNYTRVIRSLVPPTPAKNGEDEEPADGIIRWFTWMSSTFASIACADANDTTGQPLQHWKRLLQRLENQYPKLGAMTASTSILCSGWQSHPKYRFTGPFTSPEPDEREVEGRPSAPLLLLSSLYDPITPLASARTVAKGHPGARVVMQRGVGHCTLLAGPSNCTRGVMRAYMATGDVPAEGTVCEGDY
ncbi:peptidase S33, tripeptidyl-peptidase [Pochonia chlamydosporia 170]|uniref:Peptidase S33, tripeptidyl-peptidase n=1 Tax=Pochonia chlamydosporia 170 TaxID=1380566 RepID=A0A179FQU5_METCM|nr:peptidase S33, tripeptidyl-peptidase [Pochonia chlamydosporia 170]OAQ67964.2 peptidase S33, tripeptidyl-peptidase [Pochonia chlamydosporia 170]